jgi:signal transduction histidine kinase
MELAVAILCGLALMSLVGWWIVRRRFFRPLEDLRSLLTMLADGDFKAVGVEDIEPMLIPLFNNYNYLVTRLQILEEEHRSRASSLEDDVRSATQTLLEQHRSLADAERLAVVGEMAAGVAHELRNPLAGIAMILSNLRRDVSDPSLMKRLDVAVQEIQRTTRLLEEYLAVGQHAPEPSQRVRIATLVADLLVLLGYQVGDHVTLRSDIPEELECVVPRDRLRQVLLNLVLNSVQALGTSPGTVTIAAKAVGDRIVLSVRDDGPGFPPGTEAALTRAFVTQHATGTGLGLVMVRRFVQDLGGGLELANVEPHGACITLTLPCTHG